MKKDDSAVDLLGFGRRIVEARAALDDMSQAQLARAIGSGKRSIVRWEKGEVLPREKLPALSKALGKSVAWLLYGREPELEALRQEISDLRSEQRTGFATARKDLSELRALVQELRPKDDGERGGSGDGNVYQGEGGSRQ